MIPKNENKDVNQENWTREVYVKDIAAILDVIATKMQENELDYIAFNDGIVDIQMARKTED